MADDKYGHSPGVKKMLAELELALKQDQAQRRQGFAETTALARDAKEKQILDDVEKRSREATSRLQEMPSAPMPTPTQPDFGPTSQLEQPPAAPPAAPMPGPPVPPPGPIAGLAPMPAPTGPSPMPGPPVPPPGPIAAAGPIPTQPLPTQMPPAQPLPTGMPPAQPMTPDQWAMLQRQVYG